MKGPRVSPRRGTRRAADTQTRVVFCCLRLLAARWVAAVLRTASPTAEGLPLVDGLAGQRTREGKSHGDPLPVT